MFNLKAIVFLTVLYAVTAAMVVSVNDDGFSEKRNIKDCNYGECDQLCRRIGFLGGACVGDRCKCDVIQEMPTKSDVVECYFPDCNNDCMHRGYDGGYCWGDRCKCVTFNKSNEDEIINMEKNFYDVLSNNKIDECSSYSCKMTCQVEGHLGGSCVNDRCICRKKESKPHLNMLGDCNNACNNFCISKNWSGGFCIGQICFCY